MSADRAAGSGPALGVDIGGSKVAAGLVDEAGRVILQVRHDTPDRSTAPRVVEDVVVAAVRHVLHDAWSQGALPRPTGGVLDGPVVGADGPAVGVGAAGFVSADRGSVLFAPHLSWRDEPLRARLTARLGTQVTLDNDANAAAWAEHRFGAGRGEDRLLLLTLGTGIGGGLVIDGQVERGRHGMAGEFGHMVLVPGGRRCECGNRGCWEQYASGSAIRRAARDLVRAGGPYAVELERACGGALERLTGSEVTRVAREGDPAAREVLAEVGGWLGLGLANLVAALDPGVIVIGGGVGVAGDLLLGPARTALARQLTGRGHRPVAPVRTAYLGPSAGLVGAADRARVQRDTTEPGLGTTRERTHHGGAR